MAGLNDDFLLADTSAEPEAPQVTVQAFKDTTEEGELPELRDDIDLIAVATEDLEVRLRDLDLLTQNINTHGGMSQSIALEAHALMPEFLNEERPIEFFTKMPSRTQLSAALEEVAEEKKGVVRRMIEAVKNFIAKMVEKIKAFFARFTKAKAEENKQFVKTYSGPTDEQLKALVKKFSKEKKAATEGIALEKFPDTQAAEDASLEAWLDTYSKITGKPLNRQGASVLFKKDRLDHIVKGLQDHNTIVLGAMTEQEIADAFKQAAEFADKIIHRPFHADHLEDYLKFSNQVADHTQKCQEVLNFMTQETVEKRTYALGEWVLFGDKAVAKRIEVYPDSGASFEYAANFMKSMGQYVEKLDKLSSELALQKLKQSQKILHNMLQFVNLCARVSYVYNQVVKHVREI